MDSKTMPYDLPPIGKPPSHEMLEANDLLPSAPPVSSSHAKDDMKLIAIPSTGGRPGSPFLRAYPTALESFNINREALLGFLDHLNRVTVASPPLQMLGAAGGIVGFVPVPPAQIVGTAVQFAAKAGSTAVSKSQTHSLMNQVNRDLFHPHGLYVEMARFDAVAKLSGMPVLGPDGSINRNMSILAPLERDDIFSTPAQERLLQALQPWISPLELQHLPDVERPDSVIGRMSAASSERQRHQGEHRVQKKREKMEGHWEKDMRKENADFEKDMRKIEEKEQKAMARGKRDKVADLEYKKQEAIREHEEELAKIERSKRKDDKEESDLKKMLFLIITEKSADELAQL